jgi:hypothetical protein
MDVETQAGDWSPHRSGLVLSAQAQAKKRSTQ